MAKKEHQEITPTELNAMVYRYLLESGFTHSGFSFVHEAGLHKTDIQGMNIPPRALIQVVHKGLQYIELEANAEVGNDDDYHFLDTLDLIANDTYELKRKIASCAKLNSFKNDKEQKTNSFNTDKEQKIISSENTRTRRTQPMGHEKAQEIGTTEQNMSASETAQKTAETKANWKLEWTDTPNSKDKSKSKENWRSIDVEVKRLELKFQVHD